MKKYSYILITLAIFLTGCAEELADLEASRKGIQVTAGFPATKTTFVGVSDATRVEWEQDDAISLFSLDTWDLSYTAKSAGSQTEFAPSDKELEVADGEKVYGFYPAGSVKVLSSDLSSVDILTPTFNATYKENYCDKYLMYACNTVTDGELSLEFKHLFAYLKLTIPVELIADRGSNGGISISSTVPVATDYDGKTINLKTGAIESDNRGSTTINYYIPSDLGGRNMITCYIAILPMDAGADVEIRPLYSDSTEGAPIITKAVPSGGFRAGRMYSLTLESNETDFKEEQIRNALISLYESTNGANWTNNTNWCSEKPVEEWHGVSYDRAIDEIGVWLSNNNLTGTLPSEIFELDNLYSLSLDWNAITGTIPTNVGDCNSLRYLFLSGNQLTGEIPESIGNLTNLIDLGLQNNKLTGNLPASIGNLTKISHFNVSSNFLTGNLPEEYSVLMNADYASISYNQFYGEIPASVLNHPEWKYMWMDILERNYNDGKSYETDGLYIPAPYFEAADINGNIISSAAEYSNNTYTIFFHWATWCGYSIPYEQKLRNNYDKYKAYGVEVIGWNTFDNKDDFTSYMNNTPVPWKHFKFGFSLYDYVIYTPFIAVADQKGEIVFNSVIDNRDKLWDFLDAQLNIPDDTYTSTDFSQDGKVTQLQAATEGEGLDVVLMGDAYSDRQIASGKYDDDMRKAMEHLFSEEPYKTYRHLFNVYYVTAVSRNEGYEEGNSTVFEGYFGSGTLVGGNNDTVFQYAIKAVPEDRVYESAMIVLMNRDYYAGTCYYTWFNTPNDYGRGFSISYLPIESNEENYRGTLLHEAFGHGFGRLLDEYSYESMGEIPAAEKAYNIENRDNFGMFKNVDYTADLSKIYWKHFLEDARYANEGLGAYEGAATYWTGAWRPTEYSIMRYNSGGFNAPSREAIYNRIHKMAFGDSWTYDYEKFVEYDAINRINTRAPYRIPENFVPLTPPVVIEGEWADGKFVFKK